ncbi:MULTISPECIES: Tll0287-like domain-containing protein [unclassified Pseudoalteromonas]|uniref:Tll0287-like domain-containing protein n=1 Tax=unclassified Pseudoalteromonas TaxID=194690 RepID=UPI00301491A5
MSKLISYMALLSAALASVAVAAADEEKLVVQAQNKVQAFSGQLKSELSTAIKAGGLVNGIKVCQQRAPVIAASLSIDGWQVARKSNKNRNPKNVPDSWELQQLQHYLAMNADNQPLAGQHTSTTSSSTFRYTSPIMAGPLCLSCHGETIAPEVKQALAHYYPNDLATGYRLGELRGIFSLTKQLQK